MINLFHKYLLILAIYAPFASAETINSLKYSIKDLEVLEKEKNHLEFLQHAFDLKPSERNKHWINMFDHMASLSIDEKIKNKELGQKEFQEIESLNRNNILKEDEVFQFKRNLFAEAYFKECYFNRIDKNSCDKELDTYWINSKKDPDLAIKLVKWLEENNSKLNLWNFYSVIVSDQIAPLYCRKVEIQKAVIKKIGLATFNESFEGDYKGLIDKIIPIKCLKEIFPIFKDALTNPIAKGPDRELALSVLWSYQELSQSDKDFYLTTYLFGGPVVGEKMNLAWKLVESLAENYSRRVKILEQFKKIELLPDSIFNDPMQSRNKSIINLFAKNFPELLDYYGRECIDFIKGIDHTHATSSFNCSQFLSYSTKNAKTLQTKWINDSISTEYSAIKK